MTKPFLMREVQERSPHPALAGRYDAGQGLWTIEAGGRVIPIVLAANKPVEILTKTRVRMETDDEEHSCLELETKTSVVHEGDDQKGSSTDVFLELVTKTDVQQEADDQVRQPGLGAI